MKSGMTNDMIDRRSVFALMLGCLLVAGTIGYSDPAAAQRGIMGGPNMGGGGFGRTGPGTGPIGPGRFGPGGGGIFVPGMGVPLGYPPVVVVPGGPGPGGGPPPRGATSGRGGGNARGGGGGGGGGGAATQANQPFVADEIVTAFVAGTTPQAINAFAGRYNLTPLETQAFPLIGTSLYRWRIGGGRTVAAVSRLAGRDRVVANVQPNFLFFGQEETAPKATPAPAPAPASVPAGPPQYVLDKLQVLKAQEIATGKNVLVAVIDSAIDVKLPEFDGAIAKSFDALPATGSAHAHGTSIAGAIAAHGGLTGIAPGAQLLAVHAFDDTAGVAKGTSYAIYKGLQWASDNGARVINMSFAGPADPTLQRMLAAAYDKGIVLIAAAGNGGPKSDPLYPAADPNVIAVTATDKDDHLYPMANRGRYLAVSAPGVDVVALAPDDKLQFSTGTSIAAAHVSGIAALLLERKPALKPGDIRAALISTATRLGPPRPDSDFGAGLVSAFRAVNSVERKPPETGGAQAKQ